MQTNDAASTLAERDRLGQTVFTLADMRAMFPRDAEKNAVGEPAPPREARAAGTRGKWRLCKSSVHSRLLPIFLRNWPALFAAARSAMSVLSARCQSGASSLRFRSATSL